MATSLTPSPKSTRPSARKHPLHGMEQIKAKIFDLQLQYDQLLKQRQQDIAHLITTLDLASLEDPILVGGFSVSETKQLLRMQLWRFGAMLESGFSGTLNLKRSFLPRKLKRLRQNLNRLKNLLNREKKMMYQKHNADRKNRTRTLILMGGLLQKSGLMDAFHIAPGDNLQDYENRPKALQLLGFLTNCFEENNFDEANLERWKRIGKRRF